MTDPGSCRDPASRVVIDGDRVVRVLDARGVEAWKALAASRFFKTAVEELLRYLSIADPIIRAALEDVEVDGQVERRYSQVAPCRACETGTAMGRTWAAVLVERRPAFDAPRQRASMHWFESKGQGSRTKRHQGITLAPSPSSTLADSEDRWARDGQRSSRPDAQGAPRPYCGFGH